MTSGSTVEPQSGATKLPSRWSLVPLYVASAVLTLGEGAFGVLVPPYLDGLGMSAGIIGAILAVYGVASLAARLPAAAWYRSSRATILVVGGCLVMALSFLLLPLTASPLAIAVLVGLDGAGFAVATTAAMAVLIDRRHPDADAGSVMGWYSGSLGVGYAAAGFVSGAIADASSVSTAIVVMAAVPAIAAVLLAFALRTVRPRSSSDLSGPSRRTLPQRRLSALRTAPAAVWLAFVVCVHISLVHGVLSAFFPLYGLDVGLSVGQVGTLVGIHGVFAAVIRFLSGPLFRVVSYRRALPSMIVANSAAVALIGLTASYAIFALAWATIGLSRGVLRVASGALVMDEGGDTDSQRGAASGIYLAGLDVGKVAGPVLGGALAGIIGLRGVFILVSVLFPAAYFLAIRFTAARLPPPN